jgi:hypothetical protein
MDDKFLFENRPPVRKGFGKNLYTRISNMTIRNGMPAKRAFSFAFKFVLASMTVFPLIVAFFQPVRAEFLNWVKYIAGFGVTDTAPDTSGPIVEFYFTPQPLPVAVDDLPFTFSMPAYIPDGFHFSDDVVIAQSKSWIAMTWRGEGGELELLVQQNWDMTIPAGVDSAKEIQINGQPAILIRGVWDKNGKWDNTIKEVQLYWRKHELIYTLISDVLGNEELLRIAESIK